MALALVGGENHIEDNYEWRDLAIIFDVANTSKQTFDGRIYCRASFISNEPEADRRERQVSPVQFDPAHSHSGDSRMTIGVGFEQGACCWGRFCRAVYARELAEAGYEVEVIDKRSHIAGNCYDYVHTSGVRIHHYGPHLFHTSNMRVVEWLNKFTDWVPYDHCVVARLPDGRLVPAPVNLDTVNAVFGTQLETPQEVADFLSTRVIARDPITSAEDHLYSKIGPDLTDLFFRPYTQKMWELDLSEVDASVVQRLQIRTDRENRYFPSDTFQAMPKDGYTKIFERIFDHSKISVRLNTEFSASMLADYDACFNSMPIDEFFGYDLENFPTAPSAFI